MAPEDYAQYLRRHHFDPEKRPEDRGDAIHTAILDKRVQIVDELLALYPKDCLEARTRKTPKWRTPLHNASELRRTHVVKSLLDKGADVNARSFHKLTALMFAAEAEDPEIVRMLVRKGADVNAQSNEKTNARSALHVAAQIESPEILLILLRSGADTKLVTAAGNTPLHLAVKAGCASTAALLLFHGASPKTTNAEGATPRGLIDNLRQGDRKRLSHVFECASKEGDLGNFLERHVKPDAPIETVAAMYWAIAHNLERAVAYLLHVDSHSAEARSLRGWHPLHRAARAGYDRCVLVLLDHGAEVDSTTKTGWTPLMMAAENGDKKVVQILLDHDASRSIKNENGDTAWKIARNCGHRLPMLLAIKHVAPSDVDKDDEETDEKSTLAPPKGRQYCRTPSPGPRDVKEDIGELYALSDATADETSTPNLQNSEYFENFLKTLERTWYNQVQWSPEDDDKDPRKDWSGPVKIAILDTGIDLNHQDFGQRARRRTKVASKHLPEDIQRERIKAYKNFTEGSEDDVTDPDGHGTHIAGLIMTIAPRAELYIAKVSSSLKKEKKEESERTASKRREKESHPIQDALDWAIEQQVDIINMSLGFARESSYELTMTLERANAQGIIVFAAAANHGNRDAIAWPARDRELAICVTSGDEYNSLSRFAPSTNRELPIFITHGEDIYSHWPGGEFRKMSGTSVSTPIAVGMAAIILAFLNKTNEWSPDVKRQWLERTKERRIRSTKGMGRLLEHMCRDRNGLKVLSPKLMWEHYPDSPSLKILALLGQHEAQGLAG
ncbi:hypothetical protein NW762_003432 [Fusarium torreyae]|uniref:Peptidase S8/S53 domain-containing protein n=1 Tax=Fusarium torreyae TaxID=1237075 RepID=A0A9W8S9C1_9HYPO|nr:hypothetical protein NW762_003432 [Fusarium torreyae]